MSKQDRQGVRKASELEQKYDLGLISKTKQNDNAQVNKLTQELSQFKVSTNNELENLKNMIEDSALPIASADTLGGVKIGANINVAEDGTISVAQGGGTVPEDIATTLEGIEDSIKELTTQNVTSPTGNMAISQMGKMVCVSSTGWVKISDLKAIQFPKPKQTFRFSYVAYVTPNTTNPRYTGYAQMGEDGKMTNFYYFPQANPNSSVLGCENDGQILFPIFTYIAE